MGTNYYAFKHGEGPCHHCLGTGIETVKTHIGKSSYGWTFGFHAAASYDLNPDYYWTATATKSIDCYADWLAYLSAPGVFIVNEYGEPLTLDDFKKLVESKANSSSNHTTYVKKDPRYAGTKHDSDTYLDQEGHSFSKGEFS